MPDSPKPTRLLWWDFEASGVTDTNDHSQIEIIEAACVLTTFDLDVIDGYQAVVKMNEEIAGALKRPENRRALEMHRGNGLLKASMQGWDAEEPTGTVHYDPLPLAKIEAEVIEMLEEHNLQPGEVVLAGSGITNYDFPLIKQHMRDLTKWLAYYTFDIGSARRVVNILAGTKIIGGGAPASGPNSEHRSMPDVQQELREAAQLRGWLRSHPAIAN